MSDLERHIENKCSGFEVECFACLQPIRTLKGIKRHLKFECPQMKISCYICGNWFTRKDFKNPDLHQCHFDLLQILHKFQGSAAEDDGSDGELDELEDQFQRQLMIADHEKTQEQLAMERYVKIMRKKRQ